MRTAPYVVSYTETDFSTTGSPKASSTVAWKAGDYLFTVGMATGSDSSTQIGVPTATGLTFTSLVQGPANDLTVCGARLCAARADADGSSAVNTTIGVGLSTKWGTGVYVVRNCEGYGTGVIQYTATRTLGLTPTRKKSMVLWSVGDWNADAIVAETPTAHTDRKQLLVTSGYTIYIEELRPPSTAPLSVGVAGSGAGPFTIMGLEIYGSGRDELVRSRRLRR